MDGDGGWHYQSATDNDWDLNAVVRYGGVPLTQLSDDPFSSFLLADGMLPFPDLQVSDDPILAGDTFSPPAAPQQQPAAATKEATPDASGKAKRRKNRVKKVVHHQVVSADSTATSADPWAWRKYGEKPIKGSPYPRGYYRCSTDKDCRARKMVERCRTDPSSFILSYTGGDHAHPVPTVRNYLAGVARNKKQRPSPHAAAQQSATEVEPAKSSRSPSTE